MPFIGGKYDYDLFVSYNHGVGTQDPKGYDKDKDKAVRDWSRRVVNAVAKRLRIGLQDEGGFEHYLDAREAESGEDLDQEVEAAIRKSAVLLVLMSPGYRDSRWCKNELQWFFDEADKDGRGGRQHCVLRVAIGTVHDPDKGKPWPPELVGRNGEVVNRGEPFHDRDNIPIELESDKFEELLDPISSLVSEIKRRLVRLKQQLNVGLQAVKAPATPLPPNAPADPNTPSASNPPSAPLASSAPSAPSAPNGPGNMPATASAAVAVSLGPQPEALRPQLYLQRCSDGLVWARVKQELSQVAVVTPTQMEPEPELSLLRTYASRRRESLSNCQGLILMRCETQEPSDVQVAAGYEDRRTLRSLADLNVPWVLVDKVGGDEPTVSAQYGLPRVVISDSQAWQQDVLAKLGLS